MIIDSQEVEKNEIEVLYTTLHQPVFPYLPGESQGGGAWWAAVYGVTQSRT